MRKIILTVFIVLTILPSITHSESEFKQLSPCTEILEPTEGVSENAKGVALIYNIEREFNDKRTSLSIHALHMPEPSKFGNYESYEVLAYIPNEISWTFPLTQYAENNWAGKWDEISATMRPTRIKVRAINTKSNQFGPVVLEKSVSCLH
ncbi:hypothetical protein ACM6Q7_26010 [Peribacillus butanolivorans]|uniref:hypothetical protein n=1 Tax=Peribacillus butanolivorans TaxID=421767 RepID=UPI0039FC3491